MSRGRYPADRNRDLMNVAAAVAGSAAAAQVIHRDEAMRLQARLTRTERAVIDAAREYHRLDGDVDAHNELMDAVAQLEQAIETGRGVVDRIRGYEEQGGKWAEPESEIQRIHVPCGRPMVASCFGPHDPTPEFRSRPIWLCNLCQAWERRGSW